MPTISLTKGQRINLTKGNPSLVKAIIGLGWDTNIYSGGHDFDLDASAFLLHSDNMAKEEKDFIFYNNLSDPAESVIHTGDNRDGDGDGDDEQIIIDFSKVQTHIHRIAITVTIHDYINRLQNFGQVSNAYVRVVDENNNNELIRFDLGENFSTETAVIVCELYRHEGEWKFHAVGSGFSGGLASLCKNYGLDAK
ncbi:TerD family protein [Paenibacillus peoriae]|uniref:TerD family protein n=1 Tax=Paenibacillus peoriae TaxID=59893 RepID=A0A7H0Y2C1_9BACL|nr:TerD family protein [Paenibacillus peoriae]QNR65229.1 TerD family protein [Paenibacillus peoriae]